MTNITIIVILAAMLLITWGVMIYRMITSGKIRAKGAKKRRRKILPFVYKKKQKGIIVEHFDEIG